MDVFDSSRPRLRTVTIWEHKADRGITRNMDWTRQSYIVHRRTFRKMETKSIASRENCN